MNLKTCFSVMFLLITLLSLAMPASAACDLWQSVFRDASRRGFTLEFSPSEAGLVQPFAVASLRHKQRGELFNFEVSKGNGYGLVELFDPQQPGKSHAVYFFDSRLKAASIGKFTWLFVDGLGIKDYYGEPSPLQRKFPLDDPMWLFVRCKK